MNVLIYEGQDIFLNKNNKKANFYKLGRNNVY